MCICLININTLQVEDATEDENENNDDVDEINETNSIDNMASNRSSVNYSNVVTSAKFSMTLRDVEDSIRQFSGQSNYPIEKWITSIKLQHYR